MAFSAQLCLSLTPISKSALHKRERETKNIRNGHRHKNQGKSLDRRAQLFIDPSKRGSRWPVVSSSFSLAGRQVLSGNPINAFLEVLNSKSVV